jgi:chromosome segregation ATPase
MLKKAKETVIAAAEQVGILTPTLADAQAAADKHRQSLTDAQAALDAATLALQTAHDRSAEDAEVLKLEAAVAAAKQDAQRATDRYRGAEKRLAIAQAAEQDKARAVAKYQLSEALAVRLDAAAAIDRLAAEIGKLVNIIDQQDAHLAEAMRDGVAARDAGSVLKRGQRAAEMALSRTGAVPRAYAGDPTQHPGAVEVISSDNGALLAHGQ